MKSIFTGVKVVDLTKVFSGPFATRMLADYGAEVIKIESIESYDDSRNYPPLKNNWSGYYEILNRNKKGVSLNLKNEKDLKIFYKLIKDADVFVENLTPSTKRKLKIEYEILKKINPTIIYASLSGLGQENDKKYYDVIAQAQSGLMSLSGYPNTPMKIGPSIVDAFSGLTLSFAISSALFYREKTGLGQYLDVSMLSCAMNLLESSLIEYSLTKTNPVPAGNHDNSISPFGAYKTKDGYIVVAAGSERIWADLSNFLKSHITYSEDLYSSNELRLKNNSTLNIIVEKVFSKYSVKDLEEELSNLNIPCSKVYEMSDVYLDIDNFKNKSLIRFKHSKLGECVIPGISVNFSSQSKLLIKEAPEIGEDNDKYGL